MQGDYPLILLMSRRAAFFLAADFGGCPFGRARDRICRHDRLRRLGEAGMVTHQAALQRFSGVLQQMKTVSDLFSLWSSQCRAGGIVPAAITADEAHTGMLL